MSGSDKDFEALLRAAAQAEPPEGSELEKLEPVSDEELERDLAAIHLMRHAGHPEQLGAEELDGLWQEISAQTRPPWWRGVWKRSWFVLGAPIAVAAAAVLLIVLPRQEAPTQVAALERSAAPEPAAPASPNPIGKILAGQFEQMEGEARAKLNQSVDVQRASLRAALLRSALPATAAGPESEPAPESKPVPKARTRPRSKATSGGGR